VVSKTNNSVDRALGLLLLLAGARRPVRFAEMQAQCEIPKGTLHWLASLEAADFVRRSAQGYEIGMAAFEVGAAVRAPASLRAAASPLLDDLRPLERDHRPGSRRPATRRHLVLRRDGALIGD
jgi:DNA-binding IclR family transcriptional regulator